MITWQQVLRPSLLPRQILWLARASAVLILFAGSSGCKRQNTALPPPATNQPGPLGFVTDQVVPVSVSIRGSQETPSQQRQWQMTSTFDLRLSHNAGSTRVLQDNLAPWKGSLAPNPFIGVFVVHALPTVRLNRQHRVAGFDGIAVLSKRIQTLLDQIEPPLEDPAAVQAVAVNGQRLNVELNRFWNQAVLAHERAFAQSLMPSEKLRITDPVLGPDSLVTLHTSRSERPCPARAGGDVCVVVQIMLLPDKVTVQSAAVELVGLDVAGARIEEHRVEDHITLWARQADRKTLEYNNERRSTTTVTLKDETTAQIRTSEDRTYRF